MTQVLLLAGICLVALFGLTIFFLSRKTQMGQQLLVDLERSEAVAQQKVSHLESRISSLQSELDKTREENKINLSRAAHLEAQLQSQREALEFERKSLLEAKNAFQDSFKSLAADALEGNNRQFLELAKTILGKETEVAKMDLSSRQEAIDSMIKPFVDVLQRYQVQTQDLERERQKSYVAIESELKRVVESSHSLNRQTQALKDALKRPHVRGRWGEVQLRNCIELSGMSEFADVNFQDVNQTDEGNRLIPDMTVRMPGGRIIVVDAKTPIDAFLSSLEATDDNTKNLELARHGRQVKEHVKKLSLKSYNDNLKDSPDFTVMFLPNESFLYAALESEPDLVEFALQKKILVTTPPTLIGLLKVVRFGWNEEKLAQNAQAISEAGVKLHKRVADFVDAFENIGKHLDKAKSEYEVGHKRLHSQVLVHARRMESLGAKSGKEIAGGEEFLLEP